MFRTTLPAAEQAVLASIASEIEKRPNTPQFKRSMRAALIAWIEELESQACRSQPTAPETKSLGDR
ncbi:MAG TPA: hypothetical protein VMU33_14555 [Burkholderiaceae bacterium]|nr:hypothetical protein [Burkholderiaceae bacterium]